MGYEIGFGEIQNNSDSEINYSSSNIENNSGEIKTNGEICVWIRIVTTMTIIDISLVF